MSIYFVKDDYLDQKKWARMTRMKKNCAWILAYVHAS